MRSNMATMAIATHEKDENRRSVSARLTDFSLERPKVVLWGTLLLVLIASIGFIRVEVDTDPENMLPTDDPVRVRNALMAEEFGSTPLVVVGLLGDVANPQAFAAIQRVDAGLAARPDVIAESSMSVATVMGDGPVNEAAVGLAIEQVASSSMLADNVLFEDPPGAAMFIALKSKNAATDVADAARALITQEPALSDVTLAIAGQPLAEDAFGQEMFINMAIFAPLAGLLVFLILLAFFRRMQLVVPAMLLALATVIITMGALVGSGNTLHIMTSMIAIFLMPIAILDSVHVLSEFFDRDDGNDRVVTIESVLGELYRPVGFTSLTTAVGFGSLLLVPIPPVRIFGLFVALGVGLAWLFTVTLLPAYLMTFQGGAVVPASSNEKSGPARLERLGAFVVKRRRAVLVGTLLLALVAIPGLMSITVNDNPVRWFRGDHEVRVAAAQLTEALPGTYTASLLGSVDDPTVYDAPETRQAIEDLAEHLRSHPEVGGVLSYVDSESTMFRSGELTNVRMQLRTGDNVSMQAVIDHVEEYMQVNPVADVDFEWAGEAYLNLTWQDKMVNGMLVGFGTTLIAIFVLLVALFRSLRWAALAMIPVVWTVMIVYGALSLMGRDFDMPVAVLSTMVLGIGVDFAIHFVVRYRHLLHEQGSSERALQEFSKEPARALTRNAMVIAIGFSPLLFSALVPYMVVGALLASIVGLSWLATIVVLPPMVRSLESRLGS